MELEVIINGVVYVPKVEDKLDRFNNTWCEPTKQNYDALIAYGYIDENFMSFRDRAAYHSESFYLYVIDKKIKSTSYFKLIDHTRKITVDNNNNIVFLT